jgi:hypothetical protein
LDDGDTSGSSSTLTVNRSGRAGLKEGADVEVGKWTTRKTEQPQEAVVTTALGRKGRSDVEVGKWTTRKTEQPQEAVVTTALGRKGTAMHR